MRRAPHYMLAWLMLAGALGAQEAGGIRFVGKAKYLNNARAVVTHTIDDSTKFVPAAIDAMDRHGIKATIFVSTERPPIAELWPRLRQAIADGHEIGSHSRRHQCKWPDDQAFCEAAYTDHEIEGSRSDILANTAQPHVWSWCYPCGLCAGYEWVNKKLAAAGYLVARNYPDEANDGHIVPDLQTWAANPYNAAYTQVVQKKGGIAKSGNTDVAKLNAKFDEVYQGGGIYNFLSHPQWLDYGAESFYEQHMAHIGKRADVWYVPMGPLYAYRTVRERTAVRAVEPRGYRARFDVKDGMDPKVYQNSVTLEFAVSGAQPAEVLANGKRLPERAAGLTDRWNVDYWRRGDGKLWVTVRPDTEVAFR